MTPPLGIPEAMAWSLSTGMTGAWGGGVVMPQQDTIFASYPTHVGLCDVLSLQTCVQRALMVESSALHKLLFLSCGLYVLPVVLPVSSTPHTQWSTLPHTGGGGGLQVCEGESHCSPCHAIHSCNTGQYCSELPLPPTPMGGCGWLEPVCWRAPTNRGTNHCNIPCGPVVRYMPP